MKNLLNLFCHATALLSLTAFATPQEIKVDVSNTGRPLAEGWDPAFTAWSTNQNWFSGGDTTSSTFNGVTFTFTRVGSVGTALKPNYWKAGVQSSVFNVKLTGDGINVADGDAGAQIEMRISGLSAGSHTLLTYHNVWDGLSAANIAPLDFSVNGVLQLTNLPMTVRVTNNADAATAYLNLEAVEGEDVVVLIQAETDNAAPTKNVYINGFEIDTADSTLKAVSPVPQDHDGHVDADGGSVWLNWTASGSAVSHDVYFGSNSNAVKTATHDSPEFKGNQTSASFLAENLNSLATYFWRIDEVNAGNQVTKGDLWQFRPRHLAFPGAEGYGRFARGGRGGVVVEVSNLNDSGPGSLRDALTGNYGPRTVVFTVGGLFELNSDVTITQPYITVAGQTAPGKGMCTKGYALGASGAKDLIIRHIRSRPGNISGTTLNGSGLAGVDHAIMDHCSISWGIDEEMSTRNAKNVTLQRTLISEALNIAGHQNYPPGTKHGYAASIGGDVGSFHHNLLAHNEGRNWSLAGGLDGSGFYQGRLDIFNNVVYNWGHRATDGGAHEVNFVNNYYKPGAATTFFYALNAQYDAFPGTQQYYFAGNVMPGHFQLSNETAGREATDGNGTVPTDYSPWVDAPFFPSYAEIQTATNAYKRVLSDVGCTQPMIDDHDARVIRETIDGTYTYTGTGPYGGAPGLPNSQDDVGGWENYPTDFRPANFDSDHDGMPDWWEEIKGLNPDSTAGDFTESNADPDGDGYTQLEDYLNWMAGLHTDCAASVDIDLTQFTRGYTNASPAYVVYALTNGNIALLPDGRTARFTSTVAGSSLGGFTFAVTDSQGGGLTNSIGIHILATDTGNNAPELETIPDRAINVGTILNIAGVATDSDVPAQTLSFSLISAVTNASIDSTTGMFHWRPLVTQANTTNQFSIVVTDNGNPNLNATQSFSVVVAPLISPDIVSPWISEGKIGFAVNGAPGPDYALQRSTNLIDWETLLITNPVTMPVLLNADAGILPGEFYRVKVGPPLP